MRAKTSLEQQKAELLKAARTIIRLKHSIAADEELNDRLPELEKAIDNALRAGDPYELPMAELLGEST